MGIYGEFKVTNVYPRYGSDGTITGTVVSIKQDNPYFAVMDYILNGDQTSKDHDDLLKQIKRQEFYTNFSEFAQQEIVKEIDNANTKSNSNAEAIEKINKLTHAVILNSVMSDGVKYGVVYKQFAEQLPAATEGTSFKQNDIFTVNDPSHTEVDGEGKLVIVQANRDFTYSGQAASEFHENGYFGQNGIAISYPFTKEAAPAAATPSTSAQ